MVETSPGILIALGQNWEKGRHGTKRSLSKSSLLTTHAAHDLAKSGKYHTLIFSTGYTNGPHQTAEADAMAEIFTHMPGEILQNLTILRETTSFDTPSNIHAIVKLLAQNNLSGPITLVAPYYHMPRVTTIAKGLGLPVAESCETEKVLGIKPLHTPLHEYILRPLAKRNPESKIPRIITKRRLR